MGCPRGVPRLPASPDDSEVPVTTLTYSPHRQVMGFLFEMLACVSCSVGSLFLSLLCLYFWTRLLLLLAERYRAGVGGRGMFLVALACAIYVNGRGG